MFDRLLLTIGDQLMPNEIKVKKFEGNQDEWDKLANLLALAFAPKIIACKKCGYPVAKGYSCDHCFEMNHSEPPNKP